MRNRDSVSDGPVSVSPNTSTSIGKDVQIPLDVFHEADFSASESILQLGAQDHGFETLSKRLETAKRAVYRGRGIGVQVPWILGISNSSWWLTCSQALIAQHLLSPFAWGALHSVQFPSY